MTGDDLAVTTASSADVHGVIALIARGFAEYGFGFEPAVEAPALHSFASHYAHRDGAVCAVSRAGTVRGRGGVGRVEAEMAELHRLYLDAEWRGRGFGRALVETVLDW